MAIICTSPALREKLKPLARPMRVEPTAAENLLGQQIRGRKLNGLKFRRQHAIDRFIVDFLCYQARLIIEVAGEIHNDTIEEDALRRGFLESCGNIVLPILSTLTGYLSVLPIIKHHDSPSPFGEGAGEG